MITKGALNTLIKLIQVAIILNVCYNATKSTNRCSYMILYIHEDDLDQKWPLTSKIMHLNNSMAISLNF
jgi:hypothetical protein